MKKVSSGFLIDNTPWEQYDEIWVKREDLCCPDGPQFSKVRGLVPHLTKCPPQTAIGILDTIHSKAGWGVAWVCQHLNLPCYNFYPHYKGEQKLRFNQQQAENLGARLIELPAGRSAILFHQARKQLTELAGKDSLMLPNGLQLEESVVATEQEVINHTPSHLLAGTWVISVSTGTLASGVSKGLEKLRAKVQLVIHMGYSHSQKILRQRVGTEALIVDEGYAYRDDVEFPCPFPCNSYYDLKAWKWLQQHRQELKPPIVFWNIGA